MRNLSETNGRIFKGIQFLVSIFAIMVALTYGTGFLCIYTFLERFGIHDIDIDVAKGKYVYVGLLFFFFPLSIMLPTIFAWSIGNIQRKLNLAKDDRTRIPVPSYILLFNLGFVFYISVLFAPLSLTLSEQSESAFALIVFASSVGPFIIRICCRGRIAALSQWTLVGLVLTRGDPFVFYGFWKLLGIIVWGDQVVPTGAIYYILFTALIPITIVLTNIRRHAFHKSSFAPFTTDDIADLYLFVRRLKKEDDVVSCFVRNSMTRQGVEIIDSLGERDVPKKRIKLVIAQELNRIVEMQPIYDSQRFRRIKLRPETEEFYKKNSKPSAFFSPGDIVDVPALAAKILTMSDQPYQLLNNEFTKSDRQLLGRPALTAKQSKKKEKLILKRLNALITQQSLFSRLSPMNIQWRPQISEVSASNIPCNNLNVANRILLEDSFPEDISRDLLRGKEVLRFNRFFLEDAFPLELNRNQGKDPITTRGVKELEINTLCLCLMFFFLSIIAFGVKVYPYIPIAKGGGSYVEAPRAILHSPLVLRSGTPLDLHLLDSKIYIILAQSAKSLYLASLDDAGGPEKWQTMRSTNLPNIIEVSRDAVPEIEFERNRKRGINSVKHN